MFDLAVLPMPTPTARRIRASIRAKGAFAASVLGLLAGCGGGQYDRSEQLSCAEGQAGVTRGVHSVYRCDKFHASGAMVQVPRDEAGRWFGAIRADGTFQTRDGRVHQLMSAAGDVDLSAACHASMMHGSCPGVLGSLGPLAVQRTYTVYRVEGTERRVANGASELHVSAIRPVVVASPAAFTSLLWRPFEGTVTLRNPGPKSGLDAFDTNSKARIVLVPESSGPARLLGVAADDTVDEEMEIPVVFRVANLASGAQTADGKCIESLLARASRNPFPPPSNGRIALGRFVNMHAPGDDHVVSEAVHGDPAVTAAIGAMGMDRGEAVVLFNPAAWMAGEGFDPNVLRNVQVIHGSPNGFELDIWPSTANGAPCRG